MADWAGAYGAGAVADSLQQIVARQFLERKQAEIERAQRAQEAQEEARMAQQADQFRQSQSLQHANLNATRDDRYQDRLQTVDFRNQDMQRKTLEDQIRAKERTEDIGFKTSDREDEQSARAAELKSRQDFERAMLAAQARTRGPSDEPLVAIKDPTTGQPRLVRRSEAEGATPASTRDQALTEGQSNAAGFADRMGFNEQPIQAFETQAASRLTQAQGWLPGEMRSDAFQGYEAAKKNWIAAQLRKESGAAISDGEYAEADRQYFPQPGESAAVIKQKRELRALAQQSMRRSSGSAGAADGGGEPRVMTRTIRNRQTGETRTQTSTDGGATWN
jgi:hypothetical protein